MSNTGRIIAFDVARAVAVFGMVLVNFKIVMGDTGPTWAKNILALVEGRAAALFVVTAGMGIALLSGGTRYEANSERGKKARKTLVKRAVFLFIVGTLYIPIWPADILHFYGVYLIIGALCLGLSPKKLLVMATALSLSFPILSSFFDYGSNWNWDTLEYSGFWTLEGQVKHLLFNGFHPTFPWVAFLLVGMALGKTDLTNIPLRRRLSRTCVLIAAPLGALSLAISLNFTDEWIYLFTWGPMPPNPLYMITAAAMAVWAILICMGLVDRSPESKLWPPLAATGRLALTLYVAHVIIGMGGMEALGLLGDQHLGAVIIATTLFCIASVIFSTIWSRYKKTGPLEWIMRKLTS